jgi:hypothetical protein
VDFSQQPAEMSLTLSYFSILNYIQKGNLPASAVGRSVLEQWGVSEYYLEDEKR